MNKMHEENGIPVITSNWIWDEIIYPDLVAEGKGHVTEVDYLWDDSMRDCGYFKCDGRIVERVKWYAIQDLDKRPKDSWMVRDVPSKGGSIKSPWEYEGREYVLVAHESFDIVLEEWNKTQIPFFGGKQ